MAPRVKRWLGLGSSPAVGVQITNEGAFIALVRPDGPTVVGLGRVALPPGAVVDGQIRRPTEVGRSIDEALSAIHWNETPLLHLVVDPVPWMGVDQPGVVPAPVYELLADGTERETGVVAAAEQVVASTVAAAEPVRGTVRSVEPAPVAVARLLRLGRTSAGPHFARFSQGGNRWTLCDADGSLDVEVTHHPSVLATLVDGPDPAHLETTQWGSLQLDRRVRAASPLPGQHAAAAGAALGSFGLRPTANLLGPAATAHLSAGPFGHWTMERVR
ncbi:MAG: hypothetical protein AAF467_20345 [Actinomycetota bacterium]